MARIASTAGRTGRITAAAAAGVMHKLRDNDSLGDDVTTMLALVGFLLLTTFGIGGRTDGLGLDELQGVGTTFRASRELVVLLSMFLHDNDMAVGATERRELQGLRPVLGKMVLRQGESTVFLRHRATVGAAAIFALLQLFLKDEVINPTQPWRHPHCYFVGSVIVCRFIHRLRADGGL